MVRFTKDHIKTKTGYFTLDWTQENSSHTNLTSFTLFQKKDSNWVSIYTGKHTKHSISGKLNGSFDYAICEKELESNRIPSIEYGCSFTTVDVEHFQAGQTFAFLSIGILIFLSIVVTILFSNNSSKQGNPQI